MISILVFILNPNDVGIFVLYYLVFGPVLASLLLTVQATILMSVINLVIILIGVFTIRHWELGRMSDEILFNILIPTLLVVSAVIRQQYIVQLKRAEQEARLAKEQAERSNNVKSTFLAAMSHELRTPLNAILNFTKLFLMKMYGEVTDEQKEALNTVYDSGTHLLNLINDILDIARIEADGMQLVIENDVNLVEEMKPVILSAHALVKDKPVAFIADIDQGLPTIACDRRRIKQVMFNLISNAAKFTEQGSITFSIKAKPDHLLCMVGDTGPGIAAKDQLMIFQPFRQTETGLKHGSGTGLGLSISKSIVDAHHGRLWVESEEGEGTTFFVVLPLHPTAEHAASRFHYLDK
jgi:signal transduction histidine kinase